MAVLNVATAGASGSVPAFAAAAAGGDEFYNDGETYLEIDNASGGSINVTINSQKPCDQGFDHDIVNAVAAGAREVMGPFPTGRFNNSNGRVLVTYSAAASVTVRAFK
jgi:hypothetical protein